MKPAEGEDVNLTVKGKINRVAKKQNKRILESIKKATEEYNKSLSNLIHKTAGINVRTTYRRNKRESIEETPPPKIRVPKPNVRERGTQAKPPTIKPPETKNRKIQTKPPNVRERGTQARPNAKEQENQTKPNVKEQETQANLPIIKPPKTKDQLGIQG